MITIKDIQREYGQCICRRCINKLSNASLKRTDCVYNSYAGTCPVCGEIRNIVYGFRLSGILKLLGKKLMTENDGEHTSV